MTRLAHPIATLAACAIAACAIVARAPDAAALTPIERAGGAVTLPASGLRVSLPARPGLSYSLSGTLRRSADGPLVSSDTIVERVRADGRTSSDRLSLQLGALDRDGCRGLLDRLASQAFARPPTRDTVEIGGQAWRRATGQRRGHGRDSTSLVLLCAEREGLQLYVAFHVAPAIPSAGAASSGTAIERALQRRAPLISALRQAWSAGRWGLARPTHSAAVSQPEGGLPSRELTLPSSGWSLSLPDDGFVWLPLPPTPRGPPGSPAPVEDALSLAAPSLPTLQVWIGRWDSPTCGGHIAHNLAAGPWSASAAPEGLPAGWVGGMSRDRGPRHLDFVCHPLRRGILGVVFASWPALDDLSPYRPLLGAIAEAAGARSVTGGLGDTLGEDRRAPARGRMMAWLGSELALSYRDSAALGALGQGRQSLRLVYGGLDLGVLGVLGGPPGTFLGRAALAMTLDWGQVLAGDPAASPRWGGQHLAAELDAYWTPFAGTTTAGLGLGWHGLSGPLTKNASLAFSLILAHLPAGPRGTAWCLRLTPVQLLASNERELLSPLVVEWRLGLSSGLSLGVELQYIGAPAADSEDLVAEGFAGMLRFGWGVHR